MASSSTGSFQFLGTHHRDDGGDDDMAALYYQIYSPKEVKSIDPRLVMLLEYFREFCDRKRELFVKIFPRSDELVAFFKKIGEMISRVSSDRRGARSMRRSISLGSTTTRTREIKGGPLRPERFKIRTVAVNGVDEGGVSPLRPERFKIRTVVANGVDEGDGQGGDTKSGGSK